MVLEQEDRGSKLPKPRQVRRVVAKSYLPPCPRCPGGGRVSRGVADGIYHCSECKTNFD